MTLTEILFSVVLPLVVGALVVWLAFRWSFERSFRKHLREVGYSEREIEEALRRVRGR